MLTATVFDKAAAEQAHAVGITVNDWMHNVTVVTSVVLALVIRREDIGGEFSAKAHGCLDRLT